MFCPASSILPTICYLSLALYSLSLSLSLSLFMLALLANFGSPYMVHQKMVDTASSTTNCKSTMGEEFDNETATIACRLIRDFEQELMEMMLSRLSICAQAVTSDCVRRMMLLHSDILHERFPEQVEQELKQHPWRRDPSMNLAQMLQQCSSGSSSGSKISSRTSPSYVSKASRSSTASRSVSTCSGSQMTRGTCM